MTSNTITLNLTNMKQLVDLNGDKVNFELQFKVDSVDNSNFDALVVTQEMLDSGAELNYQNAKGTIGGNITADQNVYQNYFLLLKSEQPTEVNITTNIKDIPPSPQIQQQLMQQEQQHHQLMQQEQHHQLMQQQNVIKQEKKKKQSGWFSKINWMQIFFIFLGIVFIGVIGWMFYKYLNKDQEVSTPVLQSVPEIDTESIATQVSNKLALMVDDKLSNSADTITKTVTNSFSNELNDINKKISGKMETLEENLSSGLQKTIHKEMSSLDEIPKKISSTLDGLSEKVNTLDSKIIEQNKSLITEAVTETINKATADLTKTTDLVSIKEAVDSLKKPELENNLESIKQAVDGLKTQINNTNSIKNPLIKSSKKDSLVKTIQNLKVPSDE